MATNVSGGGTPAVRTVGTPIQWIVPALAISFLAGFLGSVFDDGDDMQRILYSLAAVAGTVGAILLALRHGRARRDLAAGGFAVLAILAVSGAVAGYSGAGSDAVFGSLAVLHWPALWMIAAQDWSPVWTRGAAALSGLMFALWGYAYTLGDEPADPDSPLVIIAFVFWVVAIVGWIMTLRAEGDETVATTTTRP